MIRDNPFLSGGETDRPLTKIVADSSLSTPADSNIFKKPGEVIIASLKERSGQETESRGLLFAKARILEVKENNGQLNLYDLLKKLGRLGLCNILVEGGGSLIGSFFDYGLVDKVMFFIAPRIIGGKDSISSVMGRGISRLDKAVQLQDVQLKKIGDDFLIEGIIRKY